MPFPMETRKQTAYRKAEDQFVKAARREDAFRQERAKAAAADAAKIARLRALRLAKEAADARSGQGRSRDRRRRRQDSRAAPPPREENLGSVLSPASSRRGTRPAIFRRETAHREEIGAARLVNEGASSLCHGYATAFRQTEARLCCRTRLNTRARTKQPTSRTDAIVFRPARACARAEPMSSRRKIGMAIGTVKFFNATKGLWLHLAGRRRQGRVRARHRGRAGRACARSAKASECEFDIQPDARGSKAVNLRAA